MSNPTETVAHTEVPGGHEAAEATVAGIFGPGFFVALAMLFVFALAIWKKVPSAIGKSLDKKIALIRDQLAEAESLRKDAEALKAEYEAKAKSADKEAKAMLKRAEADAEALVAKAAEDAEALVARRQTMAEAKIAAEERAAIDEIRSAAAKSATAAAAKLIAERNDAKSDKALVDTAIAGL
jgi:F-type H+-transporting ATPase subunit b